jgi:hypothetical protein
MATHDGTMKIPSPGRVTLSAIGVCALSGAAVFLFLLLGEQRVPHASSYASASSPSSSAAAPAAGTTVQPEQPAARPLAREPVALQKTNFSIARSRNFQRVGPVRVRILRISKNAACDITLLVNGKRTQRLGAGVGTQIELGVPGSASSATLVLTRIAKNRVSGYVVAQKAASDQS